MHDFYRAACRLLAIACFGTIAANSSGCWGAHDHMDVEVGAALLTNGALDEHRSEVVALLNRQGALECTGTLIGPSSVLTAAHCLSVGIETVAVGTHVNAPDDVRLVDHSYLHPEFELEGLKMDVGVLKLAFPTEGISPARIGAADSLEGAETVVVVGYGRTSAEPGSAGMGGKRRQGEAKIASLDPNSFRIEPWPSQPCVGDSGGPVFVRAEDEALVLVGVTSHGDLGCREHAIATRADVLSDFLATLSTHEDPAASSHCAVRRTGGAGCASPSALALICSWVYLALRRFMRRRARPRGCVRRDLGCSEAEHHSI